MAYIDFKKLKGRVRIAQILDHYDLLASLKESPQGYEGTCPFCGSNAFKVNTQKNVWFCFGECKTHSDKTKGGEHLNGGNILDFVVRKEGVSVKRAAEAIDQWFPEDASAPASKAIKQEPTEARPEEGHQREPAEGEGSRAPQPALKEASEPEPAPDFARLSTRPLDFTLKSIDYEHPVLTSLGFKAETLKAFGIGYFTGKGIMRNKVVIPFHNADGLLVAYAGCTPDDGSMTYPKNFDRRLELFNVVQASNVSIGQDGVVLVTDLLDLLRLHELGIYRAVALPTDRLYPPQRELIEELVGKGGLVDFIVWRTGFVDLLADLLPYFHVRLYRNTEDDTDESLPQ